MRIGTGWLRFIIGHGPGAPFDILDRNGDSIANRLPCKRIEITADAGEPTRISAHLDIFGGEGDAEGRTSFFILQDGAPKRVARILFADGTSIEFGDE